MLKCIRQSDCYKTPKEVEFGGHDEKGPLLKIIPSQHQKIKVLIIKVYFFNCCQSLEQGF
jgi:hypothetical protein